MTHGGSDLQKGKTPGALLPRENYLQWFENHLAVAFLPISRCEQIIDSHAASSAHYDHALLMGYFVA
jgi:hypothetical protein